MANDSRFFVMSNMIDDANLSPQAFRLYAHLRRVCGDNRTCTEGVRLLAKRCGMSSKTIGDAKTELTQAGLIEISEISTPSGTGHEIKLIDIKKINQAVYAVGDALQTVDVSKCVSSKELVETAQTAQTRYRQFIKSHRKARNTTIPNDFEVTNEMEAWAKENAPFVDVESETERFREFAVAGNSKVADWKAFWESWILKNSVCKND